MKTGLGILMAMVLAGCQQLPLTPQDLQARKFEAVPDKSVIYLVRDDPDFSILASQIYLGGDVALKTYPGTYYRWEVLPGSHRITGSYYDTGAIKLETAPGGIYFVQQRVLNIMNQPSSSYEVVAEPAGRAVVLRGVLLLREGPSFQ